jgi:hypothetical protein
MMIFAETEQFRRKNYMVFLFSTGIVYSPCSINDQLQKLLVFAFLSINTRISPILSQLTNV